MTIYARIDPGRNAELGQEGAKLQDEIAATVGAFAGHPVDAVHIAFVGDADVVTPAFTQQATKRADDAALRKHAQPAAAQATGR